MRRTAVYFARCQASCPVVSNTGQAILRGSLRSILRGILRGALRDILRNKAGKQTYLNWDSQVSKLTINDLLSERHRRFTPLQRLLRQAANQESWTAGLRALLPESLRLDCRVTTVRHGCVTVVCNNAASATRVRFLAPELLSKLQELADFRAATQIQIRVSDK